MEHAERSQGKSSYSVSRLFRLALDTIISFSDKPLRLAVQFGFIITTLSIVAGLWYIIKWIIGEIQVLGYTSLILSVCFFSGIIISFLGILGLYIGRMFEKVKNRPLFIVKDTCNV